MFFYIELLPIFVSQYNETELLTHKILRLCTSI